MDFKKLAGYWREIDQLSSRLKMTALLAEMFGEITEKEIAQAVYLSLGRLRPKYEGIEFNLAEKMMLRAIGAAFGKTQSQADEEFKTQGDLAGLVPEKNSGDSLTIDQVYQELYRIATDGGSGSQERKIQAMAKLLKQLDGLSAKYLVRIPINNLRLGFSEMTVLDALSWMAVGDKTLRPELERAFNVCADIGLITREFKSNGVNSLKKIQPQVGVPIRPQKSERLPSAEKIVEKLERFAVEGKWDGLRVQLHLDRAATEAPAGEVKLFEDEPGYLVRIFSRNLDNMTSMFPDIAAAAGNLPVETVILDGEAVGINPKTGRLLPFQETIQRKRKHGVGEMIKTVPLKVFVYDILLLNGRNLITEPFTVRRKELEKIMCRPIDGLELAKQTIVTDIVNLRKLREKYLRLGLEGVMCKKLDQPYQAGARNFNWVKFKKITQGELADTIDAVVMGYYAGKGKRTGFGIGAFLIGLPDEKGRIGSIAKIGTGLSDEQWQEMAGRCQKIKVNKMPIEYRVDKNLFPDVWVKPQMVVEIMADEITRSPIHAFGLALRFPRLVRFRDDKKADEATDKQELTRLYKLQEK